MYLYNDRWKAKGNYASFDLWKMPKGAVELFTVGNRTCLLICVRNSLGIDCS